MSTSARLNLRSALALGVRSPAPFARGLPAAAAAARSSSIATRSRRSALHASTAAGARSFSSSVAQAAGSSRGDDPGGKPNDGRYPTVYDDFYNITSAPAPAGSAEARGAGVGIGGGGGGGLIQGGGAMQIASMDDTSFTLDDGLVLSCPILLLNDGGGGLSSALSGREDASPAGNGGVTVLMWDAPVLEGVVLPNGKGWEGWVAEQSGVWKALELVQPRPEILVFGTGKTVLPLPQSVKSYLNSLGVQVDVQNTRAACSTFNLLIEEGRRVGAALLPNVRRPMPRGG
ncbi:hypothetical protein OC834_001605 [Tilletia horrida]|nr:hypothetical protein OC834_001605 [Tilletia horrida]